MSGSSDFATQGGAGEDDAFVFGHGELRLRQFESRHLGPVEHEAAQALAEAKNASSQFDEGNGGIDEGGGQRRMSDARPVRASTLGQRLAQDRRDKLLQRQLGFGVERREQEWTDEPLRQRAAADALAGTNEVCQPEIIERTRTRHTAHLGENPPGNGAVVRPDRPAFARSQIGESDFRRRRPDEISLRADDAQIVTHGPIARQDQMIAVVDDAIERGLVIGTAAPARPARGLDRFHGNPSGGKRDRGGKTGKPRAHDIDFGRLHPMSP